MTKSRLILLLVLLVAVGFLLGASNVRKQKWEYQETCTLKDLNALGNDGWELVSTTSLANDSKCFYLKRPR